MLSPGDRVELVACSDGLGQSALNEVQRLRESLEQLGLRVTSGLPLDRAYGDSRSPATAHPAPDPTRAQHLMDVLEDPSIAAVLDVSGGQLATGVLTYLDPRRFARANGFFIGFSNLTAIANALYGAANASSLLINPRLLGSNEGVRALFVDACLAPSATAWLATPARPGSTLVTPRVDFVRGSELSGTLVGGNLTGLLSLAGTPWFPRVDGAILALEALSPTYSAVAVGLHQLRQMGVFERVAGVLLGQFTSIDEKLGRGAVPALAVELIPDVPLATTRHFGHSNDSLALMIGEPLQLWQLD